MISIWAEWLFTQAPMWLVGALTLLLLAISYVIGARLHEGRRPKKDSEEEATQDGYIVSAVLGLLALLMGFTFALAVDRFDTRRGFIVEEANAIGTAFLRAQTFDEPHRSQLSSLLTRYVDVRIALAETRDPREDVRLLAATDALQAEMWAATLAAVGPSRDDVASSFMSSMNETMDVAASRKAARMAHVPALIFTVLLVYMAVSAGVLGYAVGEKRRGAALIMLSLLALSYLLIVDIDAPKRGGVKESEAPMEDLRAFIAAHPSASFRAIAPN